MLMTLLAHGCGDSTSVPPDSAPPANQPPIAAAGLDQDTSIEFTVFLDGEQSSDPDGDALSYTWSQVFGPDVTDGAGALTGPTPSFTAPGEVSTLIFELRVDDGVDESEPATLVVRVFEEQSAVFFVDGDNGDDELGNGSRDAPFASIAWALCQVTDERQDIYVMTRADGARYDETLDPCPGEPARSESLALHVPAGTSLYGGFDADWMRDVDDHRTGVDTLHYGVSFGPVDARAWLSGFDLHAAGSPSPAESVQVVTAVGGSAALVIADNTLVADPVAAGQAPAPGSSIGVFAASIDTVHVWRNTVTAGRGGDGQATGNVFSSQAEAGGDAVGTTVGTGSGAGGYDGGGGGAFGTEGGENGARGANGKGPGGDDGGTGGCGGGQGSGGNDCVGDSGGADAGRPGAAGPDGDPGANGLGGTGHGAVQTLSDDSATASFARGDGIVGQPGASGLGGGGGGGGEADAGADGGKGGGGGGGGAGGEGGPGGPAGGASIGILIADVRDADLVGNQVQTADGGAGATGAPGQIGGDPGSGGAGDSGNDGVFGTGATGGTGGDGGAGGAGGHGGGGGGGPSFGVLIGPNTAPAISSNDITAGSGGAGGSGADGHGGDGGYAYAVYDLDLDDDAVPVLSDNTLEYGGGGTGGGSTAGDTGEPGLAGARNF